MAVILTEKTKKIYNIVICSVLFIVMQALIMMDINIDGCSFSGVFTALQFGVCLALTSRDQKNGIIAALFLLGISFILVLRNIVINNSFSPLPGLVNNVFYIITIIVMNDYMVKRERDAITDMVTGLKNIRGLYRLLKTKIEYEKPFSVIYISIANFKIINDNYGHSYGNKVLNKVAADMNDIVGSNGVVTRVGDSEFVVVLDDIHNDDEVGNRILRKIREKTIINHIECYLTCYAGIARYPKHTEDYESLIKYADMAMFYAEKSKASSVFYFTNEMADSINRQVELESLIKEALENDYFYLVYQPQYKICGKRLRGFETLIRLTTPDGTKVSPGEFIPVAERSELILQIDDYVLRRAMIEFKNVIDRVDDDIVLSINVSAKNITNPKFVEHLSEIMHELNFSPKNLEIEITEYCLVDSIDTTIKNIRRLRNIGVQIALDDFGTGYTSLNYLSKMPINLLKVDKSLIDDVERNEKSRSFVQAIIAMGHLMGCHVISEGVENENQIKLLDHYDCDFIQGYVWGKPLDYYVAKQLVFSSLCLETSD